MPENKIIKINERSVKVIDNNSLNDTLTSNDKEMDAQAKQAVKVAINKAKFCKNPVACYDTESITAYLEYANGEIKYV